MIQNQVELPLKVAFEVVMQGIRIRLGRSLVTIMGVVLGIAFLMSTLANQIAREAVREEDQKRATVTRMVNFLSAEMGPARDRTIGVIQLGPLSETETRLVQQLIRGGLKEIRWASAGAVNTPVPFAKLARVKPAEAGRDASAVLLVGQGALPPLSWSALFAPAHRKILALTRAEMAKPNAAGEITLTQLARQPRQEELDRAAAEQRKARFRTGWILVISLLVTIMGISNAMLMSVTERFREIGTMRCLGARAAFVRRLFLIESSLMGLVGGVGGALAGGICALLFHGFAYGFGMVVSSLDYRALTLSFLASMLVGLALSVVAAIYPANVASAMTPADALRSNV